MYSYTYHSVYYDIFICIVFILFANVKHNPFTRNSPENCKDSFFTKKTEPYHAKTHLEYLPFHFCLFY